MNRQAIFVLIALNTLLVAVLTFEWVANTKISVVTPPTKIDKTESETLPPELDLTAISEENYGDLVERPMFIKGRKPVNEPAPENTPVAAAKRIENLAWELTGIYTTPKGVTAFFSRINAKVAKDNHRKYKVGEELDGWKVTEIHTDNVVLTQAGETKNLPLRKNKPKTSVPIATNGSNRVPPPQKPPVPPQIQQEIPPQNLQTPDAMQNNVAPESETTEETVNPENP